MFSDHEKKCIREYKYCGTDDSLLINYGYKQVLEQFVKIVPLWISPNAITLFGFILEIVSFFISFVVSNQMEKPIPSWCCIMNGVCTLVYQFMDNLDGKQARRTQMSSPLGQFFDHGCDAIADITLVCKSIMAVGFGNCKKSLHYLIFFTFGFLITNWEEYMNHKFHLGILNGADEGIFFLGVSQVLIGLYPSLIQTYNSPIFSAIFIIMVTITVLIVLIGVIKENKNKKGAVVKGVQSLSPGLYCLLLAVYLSTKMENKLSPYFILSSGLLIQFGAQHMIIAIISGKPPVKLLSLSFVFAALTETLPLVFKSLITLNGFWQIQSLLVFGLMIICDVRVIQSLKKILGIPVFKVKKMKPVALESKPVIQTPRSLTKQMAY